MINKIDNIIFRYEILWKMPCYDEEANHTSTF